jgi:hypothetical protein
VRNYSSHEAWKPGPMAVQAGEQPSAAVAPAVAPRQHALTAQAVADLISIVCF